jgi:hypothetical protein
MSAGGQYQGHVSTPEAYYPQRQAYQTQPQGMPIQQGQGLNRFGYGYSPYQPPQYTPQTYAAQNLGPISALLARYTPAPIPSNVPVESGNIGGEAGGGDNGSGDGGLANGGFGGDTGGSGGYGADGTSEGSGDGGGGGK